MDIDEPIPMESVQALAALLPLFEGRSAVNKKASALQQVGYDHGWVRQFDWPAWKSTPEAIRLRDEPAAIAEATPTQLARLLTTILRQDRFVEGSLEAHIREGFVLRILRRAAVLAGEAA